jgi:hypothetical protein
LTVENDPQLKHKLQYHIAMPLDSNPLQNPNLSKTP